MVKQGQVSKPQAPRVKSTPKGNQVQKTKKEEKKHFEKKILKKIEDFNKFTRLRVVKELKRKKSLAEHLKIDPKQIAKSIKALQEFNKKQKAQSKKLLEDDDEFLYLEITLNKLPEEFTIRPYQIKLPVPIYGEKYFNKHCVIVKNPQRDFEDKIEDLDIPCIGKVIGYDELVNDYNRFEEKRKLCKEFDLFFCDYKIYDLTRKPLGKFFYDRKK